MANVDFSLVNKKDVDYAEAELSAARKEFADMVLQLIRMTKHPERYTAEQKDEIRQKTEKAQKRYEKAIENDPLIGKRA